MYIRGFKSTITYFKEPHYCNFEVTSASTNSMRLIWLIYCSFLPVNLKLIEIQEASKKTIQCRVIAQRVRTTKRKKCLWRPLLVSLLSFSSVLLRIVLIVVSVKGNLYILWIVYYSPQFVYRKVASRSTSLLVARLG